jgi:hypothetical protein
MDDQALPADTRASAIFTQSAFNARFLSIAENGAQSPQSMAQPVFFGFEVQNR